MNDLHIPWTEWRAWCEVVVLALLFYSLFRFMRGTRGAGILKGLVVVLVVGYVVVYTLAGWLDFLVLPAILNNLLGPSLIALVVLFQPELRRALVRVGQNPFLDMFLQNAQEVSGEIVDAVERLSRRRMGGLIAIEREVGLGTYIDEGVRMDAEVSQELLGTIFHTGTDLHDGGVVIRNKRIAAAGCYFPLSENPVLEKTAGSRHRAGLGLSEESDALVILVSEETGDISVALEGQIHRKLDRERLLALLRVHYVEPEQRKKEQEGGDLPPPAPEGGS